MCGSLFFSDVLGWRPCVLCWYQRILMYPLVVVLLVGIFRRDRELHYYVLPLSVGGIGVSLYHYLLTKTAWLPAPACAVDVPCTVDYLNWLGFINFPFLALTAFVLITSLMLAWAGGGPLTTAADDGADDHVPALSVGMSQLAALAIVAGVVLALMPAVSL